MKGIGIVLIAAGLALFIFIGYNYLMDKNSLKTPIPPEEGVKVIFVTPAK